jgi:integrase
MGATYTKRGRHSWLVTAHRNGERERITVHSETDAKQLVQDIHKRELAGENVIDSIRRARDQRAVTIPTLEPTTFPMLRTVVPDWIEGEARAGTIRVTTANVYRLRLETWAFPFKVADGRELGDVPINEVTREMIGAAIRRIREAGRSYSTIAGVQCPLRAFYTDQIETKVLPGPNPAADLKHFVGKAARKRGERDGYKFFAQEEGPQLFATAKALFPRWHVFILTGVLAGLRWGESAALRKTDIDWQRSRIHVQRTVSDRGRRIERCKDHDDRWVKASPALLAALRAQVEAVDLEGQVNAWTPEQREWVFPNKTGAPIHYSSFLVNIWQPLLAKAGLTYRSYHATRHTFATWLLSDGADMLWVSQQLGHATISQTVDVYGHVQPDRHESATAKLDRYLTS